jgi:predicted glycosyltransferase
MKRTITFCARANDGLGKLQRVNNVVRALRDQWPNIPLSLVTDAKRETHSAEEIALYQKIEMASRSKMTQRLLSMDLDVVVVGGLVLPNLHLVDAPLCLILREVLPAKLERYRLEGGRPWDLIVLPNPVDEWVPDPEAVPARRIEAVGWIYRRPALQKLEESEANGPYWIFMKHPMVLITAGAGSGGHRPEAFCQHMEGLIKGLREMVAKPVTVVQVRGPLAPNEWRIAGVDEVICPGPNLHNLFPSADLVISAVGYNTVLELACTDVPSLLVPIERYTDDQQKRARHWGPSLGLCHDSSDPQRSIQWMAEVLQSGVRRPAVDLGPSGASASAAMIVELPK